MLLQQQQNTRKYKEEKNPKKKSNRYLKAIGIISIHYHLAHVRLHFYFWHWMDYIDTLPNRMVVLYQSVEMMLTLLLYESRHVYHLAGTRM